MAQVQIEEIVEHLESEFLEALKAALNRVDGGDAVDAGELFGHFKSEVYYKCNTWETVPDSMVRTSSASRQ